MIVCGVFGLEFDPFVSDLNLRSSFVGLGSATAPLSFVSSTAATAPPPPTLSLLLCLPSSFKLEFDDFLEGVRRSLSRPTGLVLLLSTGGAVRVSAFVGASVSEEWTESMLRAVAGGVSIVSAEIKGEERVKYPACESRVARGGRVVCLGMGGWRVSTMTSIPAKLTTQIRG
jgi:hypothetical protein